MQRTLDRSLLCALGVSLLASAACSPSSPATRRERDPIVDDVTRGECVPVALESGARVCVMSEPQDRVDDGADDAPTGVSTEALLEDIGGDDTPLPTRVDLRERGLAGCLTVRTQGLCGWCAGASASAALDALYCMQGCSPPRPEASLAHLWSSIHGGSIPPSCGSGAAIEDALRGVTNTSLVPESTWPYTHGARAQVDTRPSEERLATEGRFRASGFQMIEGLVEGATSEATLTRLRRVIASGRAIVVSAKISVADWRSGATPIDVPGRTPGYGHAFLLVGYDTSTHQFLALNSWGTTWGSGGYVRLTDAFVRTQVRAAGYLEGLAGSCAGPSAEATPPTTPASTLDVTARCAALGECGACAETSGCLVCDGRCVAASPTDPAAPARGACRATVRDAARCPPIPRDPCTRLRACDTCAADARCAWAGTARDTGACVSWPEGASSIGTARIATSPDQCTDASFQCELHASGRADCNATAGCGWCNDPHPSIGGVTGYCESGDESGPARSRCGMWQGPTPTRTTDAGRSDAGLAPPTTPLPECSAATDACGATTECCGGLVCQSGACCGLPSASCETGEDCCGDVACVGGRCACVPSGSVCSATRDCCGSDVCRAGTCAAP